MSILANDGSGNLGNSPVNITIDVPKLGNWEPMEFVADDSTNIKSVDVIVIDETGNEYVVVRT